MMNYHLNQELRLMRTSHLTHLATIIDQSKSWTDLLNHLSSHGSPSLCISLESAHLIRRQLGCDKSPTFALLNHWAITGRRRPTIKNLIGLLKACDLKRAEAFVWQEVLQVEPLGETQTTTVTWPQLESDNDGRRYAIELTFKFDNLDMLISRVSQDCSRYCFYDIYKSTNRFCHKPFIDFSAESGFKIGDGRFSSVFLARCSLEKTKDDHHSMSPESLEETNNKKQHVVAAKLLKSECNIDYLINEINLAKKIRHKNIVELLGVSVGQEEGQSPSYICLIYPYMANGSLLDCLHFGLRHGENGKGDKRLLSWHQRLSIALHVAEGIAYLHSFHEGVIIHRDIKSANILIDKQVQPKLGDFTLVRQLDSLKAPGETQYSQNIIGTSVYMPPEAFRGDISTKFDIFSFGIVLLELLTGLKPFNDEMNEDLLTYISDKLSDIDEELAANSDSPSSVSQSREKFLSDSLDTDAGEWSFDKAKVIFDLALKATEVRKRDRPEIAEFVSALGKIND